MVMLMETQYWLDRESSSVEMARTATSSRARLAHYQLAGMYSVKGARAAEATRVARRLTASLIIASTRPPGPLNDKTSDHFYYSCLEQGAKYLADRATDAAERAKHLEAGAAYALRAEDAAADHQAKRLLTRCSH
jgi:hypothetical protein